MQGTGQKRGHGMAGWIDTWLAPTLISSIALTAGAVVTYLNYKITIRHYQLLARNDENGWYKEFRELYSEFWDSLDMAQVRAWIACDESYNAIRTVLTQRLSGNVSASDYSVLEKIDKFCALMTCIIDMDARPENDKQKELWQSLYYKYWIFKMKERAELSSYVMKYWPNIPLQSSKNSNLIPHAVLRL